MGSVGVSIARLSWRLNPLAYPSSAMLRMLPVMDSGAIHSGPAIWASRSICLTACAGRVPFRRRTFSTRQTASYRIEASPGRRSRAPAIR